MMALSWAQWLVVSGLGAVWLGGQIVWVAPLPRQLRRGDASTAPRGSPEAFGLFWIDQYGYIGLSLLVGGAVLACAGWIGW